jgi:hypothetical protein
VELIQKLVYHRDGELILGGFGVESTVVDAEAPRVIRLAHQQHRGREWRCARSDEALVEHNSNLALQLILLQLWISIGPYCNWRCARQEMNVVIVWAS